MRFYSRLLESKKGNIFLLCFNLFLAVGGYIENLSIQAFCQPVLWASIALILFLLSLLLAPFFYRTQKYSSLGIAMFLQGIGINICLYCLWFYTTSIDQGEDPLSRLFTLSLCLLFGIFSLTPLLFLIQLLLNIKKFVTTKSLKQAFLAGVLIPFFFVLYFAVDYKHTSSIIIKADKSSSETIIRNIPRTYMSERILGMHYRYHTRLCIYDGQRPPFHDPFLVTSYWLNERFTPFFRMNMMSPKLYFILFPEKIIKKGCFCAPYETMIY